MIVPLELSTEDVHEYYYSIQNRSKTSSQTYFKHTIYGLRAMLRSEGLPNDHLKLPRVKGENTLPVVLSREEMWRLLSASQLLKHRIRYALHIPPSRFIRIRHYGILSSTSKKVTIPSIRQQFGTQEISFIDLRKHNSFNIGVCPCCGSLSMVTVQTIPSRGPPRLRPVAIPVEPERQNATT